MNANGPIFDSHAHYDDSAFDCDRDALLQALPAQGVCAVLSCADSEESCTRTLALAERYPYLYAACGVHPHNAAKTDWNTFLCQLQEHIRHEKCVAVGEIGLDYHYDFSPREAQLALFENQLIFAKEHDLPVVVHDREAHEDTMRLLRQYRPRGVVHCFSGGTELAKETVALGMYIGLGGAVTFHKARRPLEVAAEIPLERLLLETDSPYMTPVPNRGKRNDSAQIRFVAETIAQARGISVENLLEQTCKNACVLLTINI